MPQYLFWCDLFVLFLYSCGGFFFNILCLLVARVHMLFKALSERQITLWIQGHLFCFLFFYVFIIYLK